jgi:hypothetical protein
MAEGDLVAVVQNQSIIGDDGLHDILIMDIFIEGPADQAREDWMAWQRNVEVPVPKRATEAEMSQAVLAKLLAEKGVADGTDRQRVANRSALVSQDTRLP